MQQTTKLSPTWQPNTNEDFIAALLDKVKDDFPKEPAKISAKPVKELSLREVEDIAHYRKEGLKHYRQGQAERALTFFEKAYASLPGDLELLQYQAMCHYKTGNYDRAAAIATELQNLDDGKLVKFDKWVPLLWLRTRKYSEAENFLRDALRKKPTDLQYLNMLAFAQEQQNKLPESEETLKKILKMEPGNANACNSLAWIYYRKNKDLHTAIDLAKKALKHEPENPAYLDTLGMLLKKQGNAVAAKKALQKALSLAPNNKTIREHLSVL